MAKKNHVEDIESGTDDIEDTTFNGVDLSGIESMTADEFASIQKGPKADYSGVENLLRAWAKDKPQGVHYISVKREIILKKLNADTLPSQKVAGRLAGMARALKDTYSPTNGKKVIGFRVTIL